MPQPTSSAIHEPLFEFANLALTPGVRGADYKRLGQTLFNESDAFPAEEAALVCLRRAWEEAPYDLETLDALMALLEKRREEDRKRERRQIEHCHTEHHRSEHHLTGHRQTGNCQSEHALLLKQYDAALVRTRGRALRRTGLELAAHGDHAAAFQCLASLAAMDRDDIHTVAAAYVSAAALNDLGASRVMESLLSDAAASFPRSDVFAFHHRFLWARLCAIRGDTERAARLYDESIDLLSTTAALTEMATLICHADPDRAAALRLRALGLDPLRIDALNALCARQRDDMSGDNLSGIDVAERYRLLARQYELSAILERARPFFPLFRNTGGGPCPQD